MKNLTPFAAACFDQNSIDELIQSLQVEADEIDMKQWDIDAREWRNSIRDALIAKLGAAGVEGDQDWENETTTFTHENHIIVFSGSDVTIKTNTD